MDRIIVGDSLPVNVSTGAYVGRVIRRLLISVGVSVAVSIVLLAELGQRVDLKRLIDTTLDDLRHVESTTNGVTEYRLSLNVAADRASALISFGAANPSLEVGEIYCFYETARRSYYKSTSSAATEEDDGQTKCGQASIAFDQRQPLSLGLIAPYANPLSYRSEALISVLMVLCGIVGACGAVLIGGREKFAIRRGAAGIFVIGIGAGFFVYLILKGGRAFFLVDAGLSSDVYSNPYPMSFAAALGGMFAKQFFERLETWIDERFGETSDDATPEAETALTIASREVINPTPEEVDARAVLKGVSS